MNLEGFMRLPLLGLALLVSMVLFSACSSGSEPRNRNFALEISDRKLNLERDTIKVEQGDTVALNFRSDEGGSVHLHGYDIEKTFGEDGTTAIEFVADATGRFNFTFHPGSEHMDNEAHGALFESETLDQGDSFSFGIPPDLHDAMIPFHNHMNHEQVGSITVSEETGLTGTVEIEITADGSFTPHEVTVQPGATLVWNNAGEDRAIVSSGNPPTAEDGEGEHSHEDGEGEEITLGAIEVRPR